MSTLIEKAKVVKKTFSFGSETVEIESGIIARQADSAVVVRMGDGTVVLVTVVCAKKPKENIDYLPLMVNYQTRAYAAGKVPGSYFRREGRPSEIETLNARQIDRFIRPFVTKGFYCEFQIVATVLSADVNVDPSIAAMLGASAALTISGIPFQGPIGAARVGYKDGAYLLNPTLSQLTDSQLDLVLAGTEKAVVMVESEAKELSEEIMLGAVVFGHQQMQAAIKAIREFAQEFGTAKSDWVLQELPHDLEEKVASLAQAALTEAYQIPEKLLRQTKLDAIRDQVMTTLVTDQEGSFSQVQVKQVFEELESKIVRGRILAGQPRIDGRDTKTVRSLSIQTGLLPRVHGSALFTRGETQAIVTATLGTGRDAQMIEILGGEEKDNFMLHYNFPPYSVGEIGMMGSPKRREIGHGRLAKRGIKAVLPTQEQFPYVIRVVSEITESNGSSSMASVCGASLALMDAGVPLKAPVAGIAMGLIKEGERFAVLTDILGDEDHLGDMDFKVAGTADGVTALQMDIKIDGISEEIMRVALAQAREARLHILKAMNAEISAHREAMSPYAPRIFTMKINPDKIRDVIGKGGAVIRSITEETGAIIDITDDGIIKIAAVDNASSEAAQKRIKDITADVEVGTIYDGVVVKIMDFGAFVNVLPGKDGLLHISQISKERVENVADKLEEGQAVRVKVLEIDKLGRMKLSMKEV